MPELVVIEEGDAVGAASHAADLRARGFSVQGVHDPREALDVVRAEAPDVVVIDLRFEGLDAFRLCHDLRRSTHEGIGIIVVSDAHSARDRVAGLTAGADAWLSGPVEGEELEASIRALQRRADALRSRSRSRLTGLPGPHELDAALSEAVLDALDVPDDDHWQFALALLDVDRFGAYNAVYGSERGDQVITAVARILADAFDRAARRPARLFHLGGDDFAALAHPADMAPALDAVVTRFDALAPHLHDPDEGPSGRFVVRRRDGSHDELPHVALSVGVATSAHRAIASAAQAIAIATELRVFAKQSTSSVWRIDRRRDPR